MTRTMPPTDRIRVWIWNLTGSPTRITLKRDVPFQLGRRIATDEGYTEESQVYLWDGRYVWADHECRGRDCDGSHQHGCILWWSPGLNTQGAIIDCNWVDVGGGGWVDTRDESIQMPIWREGKIYRGNYHTGDYDFDS